MFPDPVLREPAAVVAEVDDSVRKLIADMVETMRAAEGAGLAAPQVGVQRRVFVYRLGDEEEGELLRALVNPEIVERSGTIVADEGCLSVPGLYYPVQRSAEVVVRALDGDGEPVEYEGQELEARVIQHELDHLDGVLFIDRLDPEQRREALRIIRERALDGGPTPTPRIPALRI
jgi:peptide deformylase